MSKLRIAPRGTPPQPEPPADAALPAEDRGGHMSARRRAKVTPKPAKAAPTPPALPATTLLMDSPA